MQIQVSEIENLNMGTRN